MSFVAQW